MLHPVYAYLRMVLSAVAAAGSRYARLRARHSVRKAVIVPLVLLSMTLFGVGRIGDLPVSSMMNRAKTFLTVAYERGSVFFPGSAFSPNPAPLFQPFIEPETAADGPITKEDIRKIARKAAHRHGVDPILIRSMIAVESGFNPLARSHKGAMGVMQLMPGTAAEMGVKDPYDVHQNIDGAVRYFKKLLHRYRRYPKKLELALAAYNAGPRKVRRYRGIPPYRETRKYIRKVMARYHKLKKEFTL